MSTSYYQGRKAAGNDGPAPGRHSMAFLPAQSLPTRSDVFEGLVPVPFNLPEIRFCPVLV